VRRGVVVEQALAEQQKSGAATSSEEAERTDADKAARQDVEKKRRRNSCKPSVMTLRHPPSAPALV